MRGILRWGVEEGECVVFVFSAAQVADVGGEEILTSLAVMLTKI